MYISSLHLKYFRNYIQGDFYFDKEKNIIFGNNGHGKTNLLEAIYYMSTTKSHRGVDDEEMIMLKESFANIDCHVQINDEKIKFSSVIHKKGKSLSIRNLPVKKVSEYIGKINAVLFSPTDMYLFDSSPSYRRKTVDLELGKMSEMYINQLNIYNKLLKERNAFLKQGIEDKSLLDSITQQMIKPQIQIIKKRKLFIDQLNMRVDKYYKMISDSSENISINYQSMMEFNSNEEELEKNIIRKYETSLERDYNLRQTNVGIHREDIEFMISNQSVVAFASQGQKRMIVVALKLALVEIVYEYTSEYPILLLDDVLSELDISRRNRMIEIIPKEIQTIITSTNKEDIMSDLLKNAKILEIEKGRLKNGER